VLSAEPLTRGNAEAETGEPKEWPLEAPSDLDLDLDRTGTWMLRAAVEGCWAPDVVLRPDDETREVELSLWPTGVVEGRVAVEKGVSEPTELRIRFQSPNATRRRPAVPETTISCALDSDARVSCSLPSSELDLRVAAEGFAPHYVWGLRVPAGDGIDLGLLDLARGASLSGWVTTSTPSAGAITLELVPEVPGMTGSPIAERIGARTIRTDATERGFFQFKNVPPGGYALIAKTEGRFSPERVAPIDVKENSELFLEEPVLIEPLARVEVVVDPPVDPYLQRWNLELERFRPLSTILESVAGKRPVSPDGYWIEDDLEKGLYLLSVYDSQGSSYVRREIEVGPGLPLQEIRAPVVRLEGRLSKGEEPLEATLWFLGNGTRIRFESGEDGRFQGHLSEGGEWRVEIERTGQRNKLHLDRKEVVIEPGEEFASVDIRLPNTRIRGRVVDEHGNAVNPALITIADASAPEMQVWADENGEFEALGLKPGRKLMRAEVKSFRDSGLIPHDLEEDRDDEPLELVVRPMMAFSGRIRAPSGPVPGALVEFSLPAFPAFGSRQLVAGPSGTFTGYLPHSKTPVDMDLVIVPPGFARRILRLSVLPSTGPVIDIPVEAVGGQLSIGLQGSRYVVHNGVTVLLQSLFEPPDRGHLRGFDPIRGTITLEMEGGEYLVCPTEQVTRECAGGFLSPGGALTLNVRPPEEERSDRGRRTSI
jgi:hypothetical protein